jgi:PST family polysaccharide transporter
MTLHRTDGEELMIDPTLSRDFLSIIGSAVDTLEGSTRSERREVYRHARETVAGSLSGATEAESLYRDHTLAELEKAIAQLEDERQAQETLQLRESQTHAPDLLPEIANAPAPALAMGSPPRTQDRTKLFLRNVGAGSTVSLLKIAIQLALLPIMAHLLGPKEFGIYALAVPVVAFLATIADGGVGLSLAKDKTNSPAVWSTAFWVLLASGLTLAVAVNIAGYLLAAAASEPQLRVIMLILSVGFPFLTASVLPAARLTRSGNLVSYAFADFIAVLVSAICAVVLGYLGYGAKSLACQYAVGYILRAVILNSLAFERPKLVFQPSAITAHLSSGGILMSSRVGDLICRSGENLIFGKVFGAATLGAYNFANQVPRFLFEAFSNPSWSALYAQSISEKHGQLLKIYYKVCRFMAFVTFPTAAVLAAAGPDVLGAVLGPKWVAAGLFLQILAPGYALSATASMGTALLLATNANKTFFLVTVGISSGRVLGVAAGYFLPVWGSVTLVTIANMLFAVAVFGAVRRLVGVEVGRVVREIYGSLIASSLAGLICFCIVRLGGDGIPNLAVAILTAAVAYLTIMFVADRKNILSEIEFLKRAAGIGGKAA